MGGGKEPSVSVSTKEEAMAFEGMDVDAVETIAKQLQHQADQIHSVISTVDGLINQAEGAWKGGDATQFRDWWTSQHRPALTQAGEAVRGLGQSAMNNASEQRTVSNR
jgi:uncharacterized protein YukE